MIKSTLVEMARAQGMADAREGNLETVRAWRLGEAVAVLDGTWEWLRERGMTPERERECRAAWAEGWNAAVAEMEEERDAAGGDAEQAACGCGDCR